MRTRKVLAAIAASTAGLVGIGLAAPATVSAAVRYFSVTKIVYGTGSATCPSGWRATGGGAVTLPNDTFGAVVSSQYKLTGSYPSSLTTWRATAARTNGTNYGGTGWSFWTSSYSPKVRAICVY